LIVDSSSRKILTSINGLGKRHSCPVVEIHADRLIASGYKIPREEWLKKTLLYQICARNQRFEERGALFDMTRSFKLSHAGPKPSPLYMHFFFPQITATICPPASIAFIGACQNVHCEADLNSSMKKVRL
jgi:hypothetical protein